MTLHVIADDTAGTSIGSPVQVVVPDVAGQTEAAARAVLGDFVVVVRSVQTDGTAGTVFAQDPPARSVRPHRSRVTLFLVVNPAPDSDDVVAAVAELTATVQSLAATVETKTDAAARQQDLVERLDEISDRLPTTGVKRTTR